MERGFTSVALSGELTQNERSRALLTIAIEDALVDAGLTPETLSPTCLVVLGTSFGTIFHNAEGPVALDAVFAEALQAMGIARAPIMLSAACSSSRTQGRSLSFPKLIIPRHTRDTRRPVVPRLV